VLAAPDWAGRFAALEELLARRLRAGGASGHGGPSKVKPEVGYAWRRLLEARGAVSVAGLAAETGWSARHLGEQFRAETGLSPKAAARVIRFDRARRALLRRRGPGERVALAALAADCGYFDQAHLARDFRDLAGCPPSVLLAEELRNVQAVPDGDWE
jgi:AraC-like DNA-binding protein